MPDPSELTNEEAVALISKDFPLIDGKKFEDWAKWEGKGLPTRDNCDLTNPRQALLWMFTAMPGVQGAPLLLGTDYWEMQSWRMWVLGARPVEEPTLKYQPPDNMVANQWTAAGEWVDLDTPLRPVKTMKEIVNQLSHTDKGELKDLIFDQIGLNDDSPQAPAGHLRVDDLAVRINLDEGSLVSVLRDLGFPADVHSYVSRDVADRIVVHLGLDV